MGKKKMIRDGEVEMVIEYLKEKKKVVEEGGGKGLEWKGER